MPSSSKTPSGEVSNFQLKASYWYVRNKLTLKKYLIGFLIALSVASYGYCVYQLVVIYFIDYQNYQQNLYSLSRNYIDYNYFRQTQKPKELQILSFEAVGGRDGKYDFIAKIKNANPNFLAGSVTFQLISGEKVVAEKTGFFLPNDEKYFAFFGQEVDSAGNAYIKIANTGWQRERGYEVFAQPRLKFEVSGAQFKSARESGIKGDLPVSSLVFKIKNNSAFGYWHVGVYMVLLSGGRVAGANYVTLDNFTSQEERTVEMRWYEPLPAISSTEILPEVNIFDPGAFMPVS